MSGAELQQWLKLAARPLLGPLCALWPAFRDRVLGNPRFLLVLVVEEVIGCTAKTIAEYRVRKQNFWKVRLALHVLKCYRLFHVKNFELVSLGTRLFAINSKAFNTV